MIYRRLLLIAYCSLLIFPALSCKTVPQIPDAVREETEFVPLNPDALAYIFIDVKKSKPVLSGINFGGINDKQLQQILDRTQSAAASLFLPHDVRAYQLAAWGKYPASGGKMALGASKDWKKVRSPLSKAEYWYSEKGQLSVALHSKRVFISAVRENTPEYVSRDPFPAEAGTAIPKGFNEFRREAVLSLWLNNPGSFINQKLGEIGLPLEIPAEQLFIGFFPAVKQAKPDREPPADAPQYEAVLKIQVSSETQAWALTRVLASARNLFLPRTNSDETDSSAFTVLTSMFFANPPKQDGKNLIIKTNALNAGDISLLFGLFSLW